MHTEKLTLLQFHLKSPLQPTHTLAPPFTSVCIAHLAVQLVHVQDVFPTETHISWACSHTSFLKTVGYDAWPDYCMMYLSTAM